MKHLFIPLLFTFFFASKQLNAQTVADFTVTTIHGETFNLYEKLDEGKYVFLDFFFETCQPCIDMIPEMNEIFIEYGCNNSDDIFFLAIDALGTDESILAFKETYNSKLPAVSSEEGGGSAVADALTDNAYPFLLLISPEREIVANIYPPTYESITSTYDSFSIPTAPDACGIVSSVDDVLTEKLNVFPNPASDNLTVTWATTETKSIKIIDTFGKVITEINVTGTDRSTQVNTDNLASGTYILITNNAQGINGRILFQKM